MLGHWHFDLLQDVVDDSTVPQKLLLFEVVDEERRVQLDVLPSHEIGKAFGVETDEGVYFGPKLNNKKCTE